MSSDRIYGHGHDYLATKRFPYESGEHFFVKAVLAFPQLQPTFPVAGHIFDFSEPPKASISAQLSTRRLVYVLEMGQLGVYRNEEFGERVVQIS